MLVEDSADVRWLVRFHVADAGYTVREPEAWPELLTDDPWQDVDVAIVDLHLGDPHITGVHVLAYLREHHPNIRRVVLTASVIEDLSDDAYRQAFELGDVFVSKYQVADELLEAVRG
jgi:CheY-like chemotaxis protein